MKALQEDRICLVDQGQTDDRGLFGLDKLFVGSHVATSTKELDMLFSASSPLRAPAEYTYGRVNF